MFKLNQKGFSHHFIIPVIAIVAVAGIGAYVMSKSKAATIPGAAGNSFVDKLPDGMTYSTTNTAARQSASSYPSADNIRVCSDNDMGGTCKNIGASQAYIGDLFNNTVSSISFGKGNAIWCLYSAKNYAGGIYCFDTRAFAGSKINLHTQDNDKVTSLKKISIAGGDLYLCTGGYFTGDCKRYTKSQATTGLDGRIRSIAAGVDKSWLLYSDTSYRTLKYNDGKGHIRSVVSLWVGKDATSKTRLTFGWCTDAQLNSKKCNDPITSERNYETGDSWSVDLSHRLIRSFKAY